MSETNVKAALEALLDETLMHIRSAEQDEKVSGRGTIAPYTSMFRKAADDIRTILAALTPLHLDGCHKCDCARGTVLALLTSGREGGGEVK